MPGWISENSTIVVALISAVALIGQNLLNRQGRREEVTATRTNDLIQRQGEQIDRLTKQQSEDRVRMDQFEKALRETQVLLWEERGTVATLTHENGQLRRGLKGAVDDLDTAWEWIDGDRATAPPSRPSLKRYRGLLEARPRRPPPDDDRDAT